jgi:pimeloyl-ACP methyl ester carboxylesterase
MTTRLIYQSYGDQNPQTILFLHGGGVAGWMWQPVISHLPDFHCLVPDLPDHGGSTALTPFTMELAAREAAELVRERAHDGKAVVVGLSEGAQVTVQMLASAPEVMQRAFISSALLLPMPGSSWLSSPGLLRWSFRLSVPPFRNADWWIRLNMKYSAGIPDEYFPQFRESFRTMPESQFVNMILANQSFRLPANLVSVGVPVLALAGKHEYAAMKASAQQLAAALPNAQSRQIDLGPGASLAKEHNWALTVPELFAQALRAFITNGELPGGIRPFN